MLAIAILVLAALFLLLLGARVGGARRADWLPRWPAVVFAGAAIVLLLRGAVMPAFGLGLLSVLAWFFWPSLARRTAPRIPVIDLQDTEARAILGVGIGATDTEIRAAFRQRIRSAHPDRGGSDAAAARLTAARDRLLAARRRS